MLTINIGNPGSYFSEPQLLYLMWATYATRAKKDSKFIENINDVLICLICCLVEHRLKFIRVIQPLATLITEHVVIPLAT